MADYSLGYGGVGSGMDITGMVEQLVAADRKPADNRLNRIESQAKFKLSAIGTVSSAFSTLDTALKALKSATAFDVRTVKSATDTVAAATGETPVMPRTASHLAGKDERFDRLPADADTIKAYVMAFAEG